MFIIIIIIIIIEKYLLLICKSPPVLFRLSAWFAPPKAYQSTPYGHIIENFFGGPSANSQLLQLQGNKECKHFHWNKFYNQSL